jgi:CelD/BcsL family acetyltransferase involved in cellulose biosynthesis
MDRHTLAHQLGQVGHESLFNRPIQQGKRNRIQTEHHQTVFGRGAVEQFFYELHLSPFGHLGFRW